MSVQPLCASSSSPSSCQHCGQPVPRARRDAFCCLGCETVYQLMHAQGLARFYELRPRRILPALAVLSRPLDLGWIAGLDVASGHVVVAIEGIQCAACVWAIREIAQRVAQQQSPRAAVEVHVDTSAGRLHLRFADATFDCAAYFALLHRLGYRTGPAHADLELPLTGLIVRLGICAAIAMNTMFLAVSVYLGLNASEPLLFQLFCALNFYGSVLAVLVGGSYFIARALRALRLRVLHFDVPIALGIVAAFTGSTVAYVRAQSHDAYFDTLNIFITLMLAGRLAQTAFMRRNRHTLLATQTLDALRVTRVGETVHEISFAQTRCGDHLLIAPGAIVPTPARLQDTHAADFALAWITGESAPVTCLPGGHIAAGAQLVSASAVTVECRADFSASQLATLLPAPRAHELLPLLWQWVTRWYVALVLTAAALGALVWSVVQPARALPVAVSVLVITCPCSLGLAIPLARSLANHALLVRGVFARDGLLLDHWRRIRHVVFDKTGTLTWSCLVVKNPEIFLALSAGQLRVLFNATARSRHPASVAIANVLRVRGIAWDPTLCVIERAGDGLHIRDEATGEYWLGRAPNESASDDYTATFSHGDRVLAHIPLQEQLLDDAAHVMQWLREKNIVVHLLSGDAPARVHALATQLGIPAAQVRAACRPEAKAEYVRALPSGTTLMLGDGLNDGPAFAQAAVRGAPVWEQAMLAQRADFFFLAGHLRWLPDLWKIAETLQRTMRMNLGFAVVYNLVGVSLALAGWITPLTCAIAMPSASLLVLAATMARMRAVVRA